MVFLSLGLTLLTQLIKLIAHITAGIVLNGLIYCFFVKNRKILYKSVKSSVQQILTRY